MSKAQSLPDLPENCGGVVMSSMHIRCNLHLFAFGECPSYSINFGSDPYIVGSNYPLPGFCLPTILLKIRSIIGHLLHLRRYLKVYQKLARMHSLFET